MQKKYKGILLNTKIYKENDLLVKILSNTDELISGIVYGGQSKKKRSIFQVGFYLNFEVSMKLNKPASINAELCQPYISSIINDKYKIYSLLCVTSLINLSIIEGQKVKNIYEILNDFVFKMYSKKKWLIYYFIFLFKLLKTIGYEIDYLNNKKNVYFDLKNIEFVKFPSNSTIKFPYDSFNENKIKIDIIEINQIFKIFELIFTKYHLSNFNLRLPNHYQLFKKLILDRIKL